MDRAINRLKQLTNSSMDGLWVVDNTGTLVEVNDTYCKMTGYKKDDLINLKVYDLDVMESSEDTERRMAAIRERGYDRFTTRHKTRTGKTIEVEITAVLEGDEYMLAFIKNITWGEDDGLKRYDEYQSDILTILDNLEDIIYVADPDSYELLYVNKSFTKFWGTDVIGEKCYNVLQQRENPCPFCTNNKIFGNKIGETYIWEFRNEITGRWYRCSDKAIRWKSGDYVRMELATDITAQKELQFKLNERLKELNFAYKSLDYLTDDSITEDEKFSLISNELPPAFQYPELTCSKIVFDNKEFCSTNCTNPEIAYELKLDIPQFKSAIIRIGTLDQNVKDTSKWLIPEELDMLNGLKRNIENYFLFKTSGQKLLESENKFRSFFENSVIGKSVTGIDGSLMVNQAFADMLGYTKDEMGKLNWLEVTYPDDIEESGVLVKEMIAGKRDSAQFDKRYLHKNGKIVWTTVSSRLHRNKEGEPQYFITAISNISEKKIAEKKLREVMGKLQESNRELEQFAYVASHDLQEPLRMVSSYTQLLAKRYHGNLDDKADTYIYYAVDGAKRMQILINDLLEYSRISSRGQAFVKVDMHRVLGSILIQFKNRIEEKRAIITNDPLPSLNADASQIDRLFTNLLSNALKFNNKKTPEIHIACNDKDGFYEFSISDNGVGIQPEYFEKIFTIFQRLHSRDKYEGTGIGLSICKRIVQRHDGTIWVNSEFGKGTTFYFTISKNLEVSDE
ncbi:MAG: hypothetical protein SCALA702_04320 [Melioribacteraceae bacterium]|nr:MAG: hypothetical protein SCALA702_04320 [Melioribacteraceae bacterium]